MRISWWPHDFVIGLIDGWDMQDHHSTHEQLMPLYRGNHLTGSSTSVLETTYSFIMAGGVVLAATRDAVAMIRHSTLFLLTLHDGKPQLRCTHELLQDLPTTSADDVANDADDAADNDDIVVGVNTQHPPKQGIAASAFFQPDAANSDVFALLLLVDERKLVHFEANVATGVVQLRTVRNMPRNATCMTVSRLTVDGETKHMVIVGEKTGEAVAMPFPDLKRDLKTLLGHTTSMITYMVTTESTPALLLTADRDEKIRVSHFPRVALVQSYCLGHKAALTKVVCSVATSQLAVSTSLDNTIKLWHVTNGTLLDSHTLVASADDDNDHPEKHTALKNISLAISATSNVVVVVLPGFGLRVFSIAQGGDVDTFQLVPKTLSPQIAGYVNAHEPSEATFTSSGLLAIAYRQSPFLRVFELTNAAGEGVALSERSGHEDFTRLRKHAATIELPKDETEVADDVDGGLTKKKIKLNNWKAKLPATN